MNDPQTQPQPYEPPTRDVPVGATAPIDLDDDPRFARAVDLRDDVEMTPVADRHPADDRRPADPRSGHAYDPRDSRPHPGREPGGPRFGYGADSRSAGASARGATGWASTDPMPATDRPGSGRDWTNRNLRLGFEVALVALCAYLIGVGGLPPLFDAPGANTTTLASNAATIDSTANSTADTATDADGDASDTGDASTSEPASQPGAGVAVAVARPTWTTGYFQASLFAELLGELGYTVDTPSGNEFGPGEAFPLIADGSVDFWASSWFPLHDAYLEESLSDGTTVGENVTSVGQLMPSGGLEGILITRSVAETNQITSLDQINADPALIELFDSDGDGKAEIHGCPEDFTCDDVIDEMIAFNGWTNLTQVKGDYATMVGESAAAVDAGEPVLQYTWSPSGYLTMLRPGDNVAWLSVGGQEFVLDGSITPEFDFDDAEPATLGSACTAEPCWLGWAPADIMITANNDFLDANPSAQVLFEQAQLKVLDVALANVKYDTGETSDEDLARHAQEWIAENRPTVDAWLSAARAAG